MEWVEEPALTLAVQVEAGEERWRPEKAVFRLQRVLIQPPQRQVKPGEIVEDEDPVRQQWSEKRRQKRDTAGQYEAGERA